MELLILIIIILIIYLIVIYKLDYRHNKGQIRLEKISKPKHDGYLIGLYLGGIKGIKSGNILFEKINDNYILHIENKDGVEKTNININNVIEKEINIKPYHMQTNSIKNHRIDEGALYFSGTPKSDDDAYIIGKSIKIKKGYYTKLILKNNTRVELIFFNEPSLLLEK